MPRPQTKVDLLTAATDQYLKLLQLIGTMSPEEQSATFVASLATKGSQSHWKRDRNIRDVLAHLYEWQQMLLVWVHANQDGKPQPFLPPPHNWKTISALNDNFFATIKTLLWRRSMIC